MPKGIGLGQRSSSDRLQSSALATYSLNLSEISTSVVTDGRGNFAASQCTWAIDHCSGSPQVVSEGGLVDNFGEKYLKTQFISADHVSSLRYLMLYAVIIL